jgi:hypothetical protein
MRGGLTHASPAAGNQRHSLYCHSVSSFILNLLRLCKILYDDEHFHVAVVLDKPSQEALLLGIYNKCDGVSHMVRLLGAACFLLPLQILRRLAVLMLALGCGTAYAYPIDTADLVSVEGREWAQPDLFLGLPWADINVVCPGGVCGNGTISGYDMAGWRWATVDDMNQLFNFYIGSDVLGPGPDRYYGANGDFTASNAFWADGWRTTAVFFGGLTIGSVADIADLNPLAGAVAFIPPGYSGITGDRMFTQGLPALFSPNETGAWFYRDAAPSAVPLPSSLLLLAAALSGWAGLRRIRPPATSQ